jgi:dolichol-phosphate mannosyltransferase
VDAAALPVLSVVIPVYNEQDALPLTVKRLRPVLDGLGQTYEVVAVDDGSKDATFVLLQGIRHEWPELRVVRLHRNCGHQAALSAGLRLARGHYVASIDADLQDPPEKITEMLELAQRDGLDVVYGVRTDRSSDTWTKRRTAGLYYRMMRTLVGVGVPAHAGDFRLLSRAIVDILKSLPEHQPVYRLLVPWVGLSSGTVTYVREERVAGRTKYSLRKMVGLALDSVTNFSAAPLRLATWLGMFSFALCLLLLIGSIVVYVLGYAVPGWTSLLVAVVFLGAVQLLCLGLLGEYVGRLYRAVQGRPSYFVGYDSAEAGDSLLPAGRSHGNANTANHFAGLPR